MAVYLKKDFMKFNYLISLLVLLLWLFASCDGDFDIGPNNAPAYSIQILSPTDEDKNVNDSIHVHVIFDEPTNRRLHHANVKITSNADGTVIFDGPVEANVDEGSGDYELHEDVHCFMFIQNKALRVNLKIKAPMFTTLPHYY